MRDYSSPKKENSSFDERESREASGHSLRGRRKPRRELQPAGDQRHIQNKTKREAT